MAGYWNAMSHAGIDRDLPVRIHRSVTDASAEHAAWPIVGDGKGIESQHSVAVSAA